jgi:hypothetical protein
MLRPQDDWGESFLSSFIRTQWDVQKIGKLVQLMVHLLVG